MRDFDRILDNSITRLIQWIEKNDYQAYEPFDGLSSFLRPLTFYQRFSQQCLQQFVLRFPFNVRPYLGISRKHSTKAMGFFARGYLRLYRANRNKDYLERCRFCLDWLIDNRSVGYSGMCWGNAFDYQSRAFYLPQNVPTVVWISLIGHAFLDAYEILGDEKYKKAALSSGEMILEDVPRIKQSQGECISYVPFAEICIHNSNMLSAGFLARIYALSKKENYLNLAEKAMLYSVGCQLSSGGWYYGEEPKFHWVDSWHTAYNLDSLKYYMLCTGDDSFADAFHKGVRFYLDNFFLGDGTPKFYWDRLGAVDIQCAGQALDSLIFYGDEYPKAVEIAKKVAVWTVANMQDKDGYFYFRKHRYVMSKMPMLHWGQSTMLSGLSSLYLHLATDPHRH